MRQVPDRLMLLSLEQRIYSGAMLNVGTWHPVKSLAVDQETSTGCRTRTGKRLKLFLQFCALKGTIHAIVNVWEDIVDRLYLLQPASIHFTLLNLLVELVEAHEV